MDVHILNEKQSPPDAEVWLMRCGTLCFVAEDGTLTPTHLDFVHRGGPEVNCERCLACQGEAWVSQRERVQG